MNMKMYLAKAAAMMGTAIWLTGCINLPPDVRDSVNETRTVVAHLHTVHAQDARAFELLVVQRENEEAKLREEMRQVVEAQAQAEVDKFVAKAMADYDQYAAYILGIHFQDQINRNVLPPFNTFERGLIEKLSDAADERNDHAKDPAAKPAVSTAERDLTDFENQRSSTVITYFLALNSAVAKGRIEFETKVTQDYQEEFKNFKEGLKDDPRAQQQLADFQTRTDTKIDALDQAYYSIDHSLSDLSTFLDNEAVQARFVRHSIEGFAEALTDDLAQGKLGGSPLSGTFEDKLDQFTKKLQPMDAGMQAAAKTQVDTSAISVPPPTPPQPASATATKAP